MITQSRLLELLRYNPEDGLFIWAVDRSNKTKAGSRAGTVNGLGYRQVTIDGRVYLAHRLAWLYVYGELPSSAVDHINGNKLDNRISNLRLADVSQNAQNQRKSQAGSETGILGVSLHKPSGKYVARIGVHGKLRHIGYYATAEEAGSAYLTQKEKLHPFSTIT